jgi:hypothetical protein
MYEPVDTAGQADEDAEIRDRLDLAADTVTAIEVVGELLPRIGLALLDGRANFPKTVSFNTTSELWRPKTSKTSERRPRRSRGP